MRTHRGIGDPAVYPRWRGEHGSDSTVISGRIGLSPLARGTLRGGNGLRGDFRFIPAGAGNTVTRAGVFTYGAVYPRWRGEHGGAVQFEQLILGLSPLARGTLFRGACDSITPRFIPAGAGNTGMRSVSDSSPAVYPRWRGEHFVQSEWFRFRVGLSPLARGTRGYWIAYTHSIRFIPAGAGNTSRLNEAISSAAVYPRWRGEHDNKLPVLINNLGLSPLARGTLQVEEKFVWVTRFIPAGAGNTKITGAVTVRKTVYPRWRGEHGFLRSGRRFRPGLSPLARGTLQRLTLTWRTSRFIPAGAGNTLNVYHCL